VLKAAATKWNFMPFEPGLVGGHCTGVDPYYLTYKADKLGYHSQVILAGRRINDEMGRYVARNCVKALDASKPIRDARVAVLGFTFKENCPDTRNTKVYDIVRELCEYGISPVVCDPVADKQETEALYGIQLCDLDKIQDMDAVIIAVAHSQFKALTKEKISAMFADGQKLLFDIKGIFDKNEYQADGFKYWRL
jgi:UDP-N-acetyl-D-galactosamine dehydrogenase